MRRFPLLLALAMFVAGCGSSSSDGSGQDVTLALGPRPDAADAGIYLATQRGFDEAAGVMLHPTPVADPAKAVAAGAAGMAVLDIHQLALARAAGRDLVGVMALVARPVPELRPPGLRARTRRTPGAPAYPELVLAVPRSTISDDPGTVRSAVAALRRGYGEAYVDPAAATEALVTSVPGLRAPAISAQLDRLGPDFQGSLPKFGVLDPAVLRAWAAWEPRTGLVKRPPDAALAFDERFAR